MGWVFFCLFCLFLFFVLFCFCFVFCFSCQFLFLFSLRFSGFFMHYNLYLEAQSCATFCVYIILLQSEFIVMKNCMLTVSLKNKIKKNLFRQKMSRILISYFSLQSEQSKKEKLQRQYSSRLETWVKKIGPSIGLFKKNKLSALIN